MRKRDREKIAKELYDIVTNLDHFVLKQLNQSAWYFERNSEGKGVDFGYTSQRNAMSIARRLKKLLDITVTKMEGSRRVARRRL